MKDIPEEAEEPGDDSCEHEKLGVGGEIAREVDIIGTRSILSQVCLVAPVGEWNWRVLVQPDELADDKCWAHVGT